MRRSGFTLIELLVVSGIIGVLVALVVPAVQNVRESANRTVCQNNLRQMGLALHSYYTIYNSYPAAYTSQTSSPALPGWGWGTTLLPYLEQAPLWEGLNPQNSIFGGGANPAPATPLTQTCLPVFRCPSDVGTPLNTQRFSHATSNYRAVAGTGVAYPPLFTPNEDFGGVMFQNSQITMASITDGTSNTLALGECSFNMTKNYWGAIWVGMTGLNTDGARVSDVMWWIDQTSSTINGSSPQSFSSSHSGGAYFVFCDGSVRFFSDGADITTLRYMAGRNDGVIVNAPD